MHHGAPLLFRGGSTEQREAIGNAVPPPVGRAIAEQMLLCLLAAGSFFLSPSDGAIWANPKLPWALRERPVLLDDGATVKKARPRHTAPARLEPRRPRAQVVQTAAIM